MTRNDQFNPLPIDWVPAVKSGTRAILLSQDDSFPFMISVVFTGLGLCGAKVVWAQFVRVDGCQHCTQRRIALHDQVRDRNCSTRPYHVVRFIASFNSIESQREWRELKLMALTRSFFYEQERFLLISLLVVYLWFSPIFFTAEKWLKDNHQTWQLDGAPT